MRLFGYLWLAYCIDISAMQKFLNMLTPKQLLALRARCCQVLLTDCGSDEQHLSRHNFARHCLDLLA